MFRKDSHREDLLASFEREREAMQQTIRVLADQVDYLRFQLTQIPHMGAGAATLPQPNLPEPDAGFRPYMSEEEEELLALRLNDHISQHELDDLREELAPVIPLHSLELDE